MGQGCLTAPSSSVAPSSLFPRLGNPEPGGRSGGCGDPERGLGNWLLVTSLGVPISERAGHRKLELKAMGWGPPHTIFLMRKLRYTGGKSLASASQLLRAEPRSGFRARKVPCLTRRVSTPSPSWTAHSNRDLSCYYLPTTFLATRARARLL